MPFEAKGFSQDSRALIARLEDAGVTFRLSSKNHAIGTAPHGVGTVAIPRKLSSANRSMKNATASAERMLRQIQQRQPAMPTIQAIGKAADALRDGGSEIGDKIIMRGIEKKVEDVKDTLRETDPTIVSVKPWLAHKASSKDGGTKYESHAVNERTWSNGVVDYGCSFCDYGSDKPVSVARHYGRSNDHPRKKNKQTAIPAVDYTEPMTHRHTPSASRIEAILALLAQHPDAAKDASLEELVRLILAADMERDPLYERGTVDGIPQTDTEIVARVRMLVGASGAEEYEAKIKGLSALVNDYSVRLMEAEAEVDRLKNERVALRDLLNEEGS